MRKMARKRLTAAVGVCAITALGGIGLQGAEGSGAPARASGAKVDKRALPLGDGKVTTSGPRRGWIYVCRTSNSPAGAFEEGPWINATDNTYDITAKVTVDGSVQWPQAIFDRSTQDGVRTLSGNGLPVGYTTGTFPIATTDDAYSYDRNPNSIGAQSLSYSLPREAAEIGRDLPVGRPDRRRRERGRDFQRTRCS